MREVLTELATFAADGDRLALATVLSVKRSAPRPPGAKMVVTDGGRIAGSVSGGCVEGAVVEAADGILRGAQPRVLSFGIADADAWEVGLPCGGEIDVWVQAYEPGEFERRARAGERVVEVTKLEGEGAGAKLLVGLDGLIEGTLGDADLDRRALAEAGELIWNELSERRGELFYDVAAPDPRLILFGAVDITVGLTRLAKVAGWRTFVVDPRARFADPERFPDADGVIAAWPQEAFDQLGGIDPATSIVVLTHDPKLDDAALQIALRSPARFVGAMGSRTATESRRERLLAGGLTELEIDRLAAPLGLDLGAIGREETAFSILGEVIAARHGHEGGRLRHATGRIHQVPA